MNFVEARSTRRRWRDAGAGAGDFSIPASRPATARRSDASGRQGRSSASGPSTSSSATSPGPSRPSSGTRRRRRVPRQRGAAPRHGRRARRSSRSSTRRTGSSPGDVVKLKLPLDKLHLFDAESGADARPGARGRRGLTARRQPREPRPIAAGPSATGRPQRRRAPRPAAPPTPTSTERVVDSRVVHRGPLPGVPGRHDRAGRRLARRARHRRAPGRGRGARARRRRPRLLMVRQWRIAGRRRAARDPGRDARRRRTASTEDPDLAARRELEEETGYRARDVAEAGRRSGPRPGFATELMHLYLATDLEPADGERAPGARRGRAPRARASAVRGGPGGRRPRRDPRREVDRRRSSGSTGCGAKGPT